MILELYIVFLALSIVFIFAGKYADLHDLQLAGTVFLFVLGLVLVFGGVSYKVGATSTESHTYLNATTGVINTTTLNQTFIYANYDNETVSGITVNHFFGFLLTIIGIFSFILSLFQMGPDHFLGGRRP